MSEASRTHGFDPADWRYLAGPLRLKSAERADSRSLDVADFLDPGRCRELLDHLGPVMGSPERRTTASLLSKRLAFLLTGAPLYALSVCDRRLDLSAANCIIEYSHDDGLWTSSLPLWTLESEALAASRRHRARREILHVLFAQTVAPLWRTLQDVGGVPERILWENLAVRVYSLYERRLSGVGDALTRQRREADYGFLLTAQPSLFGLDFNPLARFFHPRTRSDDDGSVRFRRTCCLYFKATRPSEYCQACPLIKPREPA
ncbi:IucA/IucC family C-terminal-domain containing protein [Salinicola acroporae]|uniref:Siderophore-iron reductase, Fe-S cluster protein n=1 Tax=Salinicola acroporae TaxID=1541440 RepID=A0ABT6I592_9GAMM|nr:IucA/IucC family C-terminal-domain containing protein [Salinicola acroporae]MDH4572827.1 siderophore-iron reductase, Fe-S cluster protein [Salinicola acroporae]